MINVMHVVYGGPGGTGRNILNIARHYDLTIFKPTVVLVGYEIDPQYLQELNTLEEKGITGVKVVKKSKWDLSFCLSLRKIMAQKHPDVVLFHTPVAYFWGRLAAVGLNIRLVVSVCHLAMPSYYRWFGRLVNLIQTHLLTDKVVCISEAVKKVVKKELLLSDKKIRVIENGIPLERYTRANSNALFGRGTPRLKMISRMDGQKDPATLIKAIKLLKDEGTKVTLDFVGEGHLRKEMELLAAQLEVNDRVFFLGLRNDVGNLLQDTDIFVLSTHGEGLPISLLEAMAVGLPCIATAVPGTVGVIEDGVTGLLVPEHDAKFLSKAIEHLMKHRKEACQMAEAARKQAEEKYDIQRTVRQYEQLYKEYFCT